MLLGYLYFRLAGEAYALVSIGLISFAAVAQFAPAMLGGLYWKGGTKLGALIGLCAGFVLWLHTLLLPSFVKSGWLPSSLLSEGPWGIAVLKPEQLLGLTGLDSLTHSLFWSLLANVGAYVVVSLARSPSGQEASQALLFVDIFERAAAPGPVFWRGRARVQDLLQLAGRFLGADRARELIDEHLRSRLDARGSATGSVRDAESSIGDAQLVQLVETQLAGSIGSASARVMVASVVEEEPLALEDVLQHAARDVAAARLFPGAGEQVAGARARHCRIARRQPGTLSLDRLKDDFVASVSHELRTPLTAIRAVTELMRDDAQMPAAQRETFLNIIVTETARLGRLVNQVLDMAKIESGHGEWRNSDVDVRELLTQAVQTTAAMFEERGATVRLHLPDSSPVLRADRDRLLQVVMNLLSNAAKFLPREGGRVDLRLQTDSAGVTVEVAGQRIRRGAGSAGAHLRKISPGWRRNRSSAGNRSGLADQSPDHRAFRRPPVAAIGAGTRRLFRIFRALVRARRQTATEAGAAQGSSTMSHRIVIADDEPNLLIPLEYMLKREGFEVTVARDGQEALEAIALSRPQLVLLDVMMPRKSGLDVCQVLRADDANLDIRILLLTAKGRDDDVAKGLALGADAYVTKPFSPKELRTQGARITGSDMTAERRQVLRVVALAGALTLAVTLWVAAVVGAAVVVVVTRRTPFDAGTHRRAGGGSGHGCACRACSDRSGLRRLQRHFVAAPSRLLEHAQTALASNVDREIESPPGNAALLGLAAVINQLVAARATLRQDIEQKVREASREIEQERSRLAALMSELTQSVVVCNLEGRILLYNNQARLQFKALSGAPTVAGGAELMGLGRSIYAVLDPKLVAHALDNVRKRMGRGAADPSTQVVTATPAGQLLRVTLAPVRSAFPATLREKRFRAKRFRASRSGARGHYRFRADARQHHRTVRGREPG